MTQAEPTPPMLIYFADPMCSWCWGFAPVIEQVRARWRGQFQVGLVMGGLRPGTTEPLGERQKTEIREHWQHVMEASGQPFDFAFFDRPGFIYDTEPASRAVVAVRKLDQTLEFDALEAVQRAFYAENRDVTSEDELIAVAVELGLDADAFVRIFHDEETRYATGNDFRISQTAGVRGFPTLVAGVEGQPLTAITVGFQPWTAIEPLVEYWIEHQGAGAPADA